MASLAQQLPTHFVIVCDLDGTILPGPRKEKGELLTPSLKDGCAFAPICSILRGGATIVAVTGSKLTTHKKRFWDDIPLEVRKSGRCFLFCETGMSRFIGDPTSGEPVEDLAYGPFPGNQKKYLSKATVDLVVAGARQGIKQWFSDLKKDPKLLDKGQFWLLGLADKWCLEDAPLTSDVEQVPRIEVRGDSPDTVVGVMIAGVPVQYGTHYLSPRVLIPGSTEGQPTGRLCFDVVVAGLNKQLVLDWMLREQNSLCSLTGSNVVCFGDSPHGNDAGLAAYHDRGIPFISVCAVASKVPKQLLSWHVGGNEVGSGNAIKRLAKIQAAQPPLVDLDVLRAIAAEARAETAGGDDTPQSAGSTSKNESGSSKPPPVSSSSKQPSARANSGGGKSAHSGPTGAPPRNVTRGSRFN